MVFGKKLIATEFAKALLCMGEGKYCNKCKSCIEFSAKNNPDFLYIEPEGSSIKIEQIRYLQNKIQEKPIISNKKVYIINDANLMTVEAQNCLLKTLEEPPEYATIILIGNNENLFLATIKSRCVILHFKSLENAEIKKFLEENYNEQNLDANVLGTFQGSIGKALILKNRKQDYEKINEIFDNIEKTDIVDIVKLADPLYKAKEDIFNIFEYINVILLRKARKNYLYANCINIIEETKVRLKRNVNYDMCIDYMLFNIWEEIN